MANAIRLTDLVRTFEEMQVTLACKTLENPIDFEDYLVAVGKYRQLESLSKTFQNKLDKNGKQGEDFTDDPESEDEPAVTSVRRPRARGWGGR